MSSVESSVSSAKKSKRGTKRTPATSNSPRATAAQSPDLAMQVSELQGQIAALKALVEHTQVSPSPVSAFQSQPSSSSLATRHSPLATAAQQPQPPATAVPPLPVYELKETRPVGYQSQVLLDSSSEESQGGFFTGLLDRARIQWLMGDWEALSKLDLEQIGAHPDRAKLALLGSMGYLQTGRPTEARKFLAFAKAQGCSSKLIKTILLSGIHTSMYSANLLNGRENNAGRHKFELDRLGLPSAARRTTNSMDRQPSGALLELKNPGFEIPPRINALASQVVRDPNPTEKSTRLLQTGDFSPRERFFFLCELSTGFQKIGNKMVASSYLEEASHFLPTDHPADYQWHIVKKLLELGLPEEAFAKRLLIPESHPFLSSVQITALQKAGENLLEKIFDFKGHGHELLLSISQKYAGRLRTECAGRKPVFIEIGTTRESAAGQGSTRRLAEMCHREKFHFITVDMDRVCTDMAKQMFLENGFPFEAIHSKGEEFLAKYPGPIDAIFLDAYDFDHGMHTELRQSRYEKFLGARISEPDCHRMHLDCASELIKKAHPWTLVCVDDTWLHFGRWTAKGTLAVPQLLKTGYHLLDVRNKAVLMGSSYWLEKIQPAAPY